MEASAKIRTIAEIQGAKRERDEAEVRAKNGDLIWEKAEKKRK